MMKMMRSEKLGSFFFWSRDQANPLTVAKVNRKPLADTGLVVVQLCIAV